MGAVARLEIDTSDHGGWPITASGDVLADGIGVVRLGDLHFCPIPSHGVTPFVTASTTVRANGRGVVATGVGHAGCGAVMATGSPTVNAGE